MLWRADALPLTQLVQQRGAAVRCGRFHPRQPRIAMTSTSLPLLLLAVPLLMPSSGLLAQGEVDSKTTVKKGTEVWFVHETTTSATVEMRGQEVSTTQTTARTLQISVRDLDADGNFLVETRIVRVHGNVVLAMAQGEFGYDSATDGEDDGGAPMPGIKKEMTAGAKMTFAAKVGPTGRVLELGQGADAILAASKGAHTTMHALDKAGLQQLVEEAFGILPEKRTAGGAQWTRERAFAYGKAPTREKVQLTLSKVDLDTFVIEGSGTVELAKDVLAANPDVPASDAAELARQMKSTTVKNGKVVRKQTTSRDDGFVATASTKLEMDLETAESQMGAVTTHLEITTALRRTTAEAALPKPAAVPPGAGK